MGPHLRACLLAGIFILAVTWPVLDVGFLADDFHTGHRIAELETESPGIWGSVTSAFGATWTKKFDVLRPLTLMTLQMDYAIFGPSGRRHHITSLVLWLVTAGVFGSVAWRLTGKGDALSRGVSMALFGVWPAAVEALGWLVAREDILLTLFTLLTIRNYLAHPNRPFLWCVPLIAAFLSKETAVVVPVLLLWLELFHDRRLQRHLLPIVVLGAYLAARFALFGRVGMTYLGVPYWDYLTKEDSLTQIAASLSSAGTSLTVPVNDHVIGGLSGMAAAAFLVPLGLIAGTWVAARKTGDLRLVLQGLGWIIGPLLLVSPVLRVGPGLQVGRTLLLPGAGFLILVCLGLARLRGQRPRLAGAISCWLLVAAGSAMILNLSAWQGATLRTEGLLHDLASLSPDRDVILVGGRFSSKGDMPAELILHEGAWILSAGLVTALQRPFREVPLPSIQYLGWDELVSADPQTLMAGEPQLVAMRAGPIRPEFVQLTPTPVEETLAGLVQPHGAGPLNRDVPIQLAAQVTIPDGFPRRGLGLRVVVADLEGNRSLGSMEAPLRQAGTLALTMEGASFDPPLVPELLRALPSPAVLTWIEALVDNAVIGRTRISLIRLR